MTTWVSVDIETSGLDTRVHEVIEVGMVTADGVEIAFSLKFDGERADPKALEINGWGKRPFAPCLTVYEAVDRMYDVFYGQDVLLVASPAHFDVAFLEAFHRRNGYSPPWSHRNIIDIKTYACAKWGVLTPLSNKAIGAILGVPPLPGDEQHTALNDARWQAEIFRRLTR